MTHNIIHHKVYVLFPFWWKSPLLIAGRVELRCLLDIPNSQDVHFGITCDVILDASGTNFHAGLAMLVSSSHL